MSPIHRLPVCDCLEKLRIRYLPDFPTFLLFFRHPFRDLNRIQCSTLPWLLLYLPSVHLSAFYLMGARMFCFRFRQLRISSWSCQSAVVFAPFWEIAFTKGRRQGYRLASVSHRITSEQFLWRG